MVYTFGVLLQEKLVDFGVYICLLLEALLVTARDVSLESGCRCWCLFRFLTAVATRTSPNPKETN